MTAPLRATAVTHPNIALSKYWGKRDVVENTPAVPSLSVTLSGFETTTTVSFEPGRGQDEFVLGGRPGPGSLRITSVLDKVRAASGMVHRALVTSENNFPTASGLASSASGFAALALAAVHAAGLDWDLARTSALARSGSASAARSMFGGYVELPAEGLSAAPFAAPDVLPLSVLVAVVTEDAKDRGSTDAMKETMQRSPYYDAWLRMAPRVHASLKRALLAGDFDQVGALTEESTWAMHASAMAAGIVYVRETSLAVIREVKRLEHGVAFFTMDAGPHVKVFARPEHAQSVAERLERVPGVLRVHRLTIGSGARLV